MITHIFHSTVVSGPETLALPALARLKNNPEPVTILFLDEQRVAGGAAGPVAYARSLGHEVYTVPVQGRWDRTAFVALGKVLERLGTRIAHAHDVKASLYLLQAVKRMKVKPRLASTHHGTAARPGLVRLYEELYVRWALPRFDAVFCVCEVDYASLRRRGVRPARLFIHLNGVDRDLVAPGDREASQISVRAGWRALDPAISPEPIVLLGAVARLSSEKRHDRMIRALAEAKRVLGDSRKFALLCFGIGSEEASLKALTQQLGMQTEIRWMGYSKTIGQETVGFDLLLCLSDGEGIPVNLLEAGWAGTPVLSTSVGGIPDLLNSPTVGFLVAKSQSDQEIGRELARIISACGSEGATSPTGIGRNFQQRVVNGFSEKAWLSRLREVYSSLV